MEELGTSRQVIHAEPKALASGRADRRSQLDPPRWACPIGRVTAWLQGGSTILRPRERRDPNRQWLEAESLRCWFRSRQDPL